MTRNKVTDLNDVGVVEFLEASYLHETVNGRVGKVVTLFKLDARAIFNLAAADVSSEHRHGLGFRDTLEKYGAVLHNGVDARGRVVAAYRYYEAESATAMEAGKATLMTTGYYQEGRQMDPAIYVWVYPDKEFQNRVVELPFWAKARRSGLIPV